MLETASTEGNICDPISLAISATALAAVGTGVSAISKVSQDNYQAKVAQVNEKQAASQAADANARGVLDQQRLMRRNAQVEGQQRAALSANGIETDFGSAGQVQTDTATLANEDYQTQATNTAREVQGYDIQSANFGAQAAADKSAAGADALSGAINFGSTILSGAKQVGSIKASQSAGKSGWSTGG